MNVFVTVMPFCLVLFRRSKIVFKTAGVLLDELREKGTNALKYKVIILDEVHERSVESDLVLVCLKQFLMRNNDLRLTFSFLLFLVAFFTH
jgi:HrpA-like RNA helicase